ncbi:unnamed protein product [Microthlaspi erraticum]|uniref:RNase H type-1 domain-containing protein n=1 Tax=Microthlaspi erraticum TaxID=1685480 RepID=A0A6D2LF39_9BRAS|nr:unnamed protein product [Microthlaspi erraticum]
MWDKILPFVSDNLRLELMSLVVDTVTGATDRLSWLLSPSGEFSVRSAYALLTRNEAPRQSMESFFRRIWNVMAPERVKFFLWLAGNQCVMTNAERKRRHLCDSDICPVCKGGVETLLYIIRDCSAMQGIWTRLVPARKQQEFFMKPLLPWLYENLGEEGLMFGVPWSTLFGMSIWWGWKWRCGNIFGDNGKCRDRVQDLAKEVLTASEACSVKKPRPLREEQMIRSAAAGGALRNNFGDWCGGFALHIGRCTEPLAELWGVYYGLCIAWDRKILKLEVEVDSELVVGFLTTGIGDSHPLSFLVHLCHGFIKRDWEVRISHVYREANRLADGLANYAFNLALGFHSFVAAPLVVTSLLQDDVLGSAHRMFAFLNFVV